VFVLGYSLDPVLSGVLPLLIFLHCVFLSTWLYTASASSSYLQVVVLQFWGLTFWVSLCFMPRWHRFDSLCWSCYVLCFLGMLFIRYGGGVLLLFGLIVEHLYE
jgi:hypothetical protein